MFNTCRSLKNSGYLIMVYNIFSRACQNWAEDNYILHLYAHNFLKVLSSIMHCSLQSLTVLTTLFFLQQTHQPVQPFMQTLLSLHSLTETHRTWSNIYLSIYLLVNIPYSISFNSYCTTAHKLRINLNSERKRREFFAFERKNTHS